MSPAKNPTSRSTRSRSSTSRATRGRGTASRSTRSRVSFKEPAALKRLSKSLDGAHDALSELQKQTGNNLGQNARNVYKDLRTVVTSARRNSGKLTTALQRDFEQAQKRLKAASSGGASRKRTTGARRGKAAPRRRTATASRRSSSRARSSSGR